MRTFAIGSQALIPGDPETLRNRGICSVEEVTVSRISETGSRLDFPRVEYIVTVPELTSFALFGEELLPTPDSVFAEHPVY